MGSMCVCVGGGQVEREQRVRELWSRTSCRNKQPGLLGEHTWLVCFEAGNNMEASW